MDIQSFNFGKNFKKPIIEKKERSEIINLGEDNRLPYQLLNYYTNSSINRAIIQRKKNMFIGNGVSFDSIEDERIDKKTQKFIDSVNPNETMDEVFDKVGLDIFLYGGSYLQIIWSKNGKNILEIYHMPFYKMRSGDVNKYNIVEKYYYNPSNLKQDEYKSFTDVKDLIEFPAFSTEKNKGKAQILFIKETDPSNPFYPYPDYISSLTDLDTDVEISNFHNSALYNGFNPGMMVVFTGVEPSQEEKDEFMKGLNDKYKGSDNANRVIVFYSDGENAPEITQLDVSDMDKRFDTLQKTTINNIVSGHQIPRALASLEQPGSLGNTKELITATQVFTKNYIEPKQSMVLKSINKIMTINKLNELYIINPNVNVYMYELDDLGLYLNKNEVRNFLGYEEIEEEVTTEEEVAIIEEEGDEIEIDTTSDTNILKKIWKKLKRKENE